MKLHLKCFSVFKKTICSGLAGIFFLSLVVPITYAQEIFLPAPGSMVSLSPAFEAPTLKGLNIHAENPFLLDFIVNTGTDKVQGQELKAESERLVKFFLAALTIPDKEAWVNLSPYEANRIIPPALSQTEMGKVMLEQDYILKQLSASLTNPDTELGRKYWDEVNKKSQDASVDSPASSVFTKVWIVPASAEVAEKDGKVYITQSHLKVMMEEDYRSLDSQRAVGIDAGAPATAQTLEDGRLTLEKNTSVQRAASNVSTEVFRSIILPKLEEEVNQGKNFAQVRQIYEAAILAVWYKNALKESLLGQIYADQAKVKGVEVDDPSFKEKVYNQYLEAFKKGVYNIIKEDSLASEEATPRKYFSGGLTPVPSFDQIKSVPGLTSSAVEQNDSARVTVQLDTTEAAAQTIAQIAEQRNRTSSAVTLTDYGREQLVRQYLEFIDGSTREEILPMARAAEAMIPEVLNLLQAWDQEGKFKGEFVEVSYKELRDKLQQGFPLLNQVLYFLNFRELTDGGDSYVYRDPAGIRFFNENANIGRSVDEILRSLRNRGIIVESLPSATASAPVKIDYRPAQIKVGKDLYIFPQIVFSATTILDKLWSLGQYTPEGQRDVWARARVDADLMRQLLTGNEIATASERNSKQDPRANAELVADIILEIEKQYAPGTFQMEDAAALEFVKTNRERFVADLTDYYTQPLTIRTHPDRSGIMPTGENAAATWQNVITHERMHAIYGNPSYGNRLNPKFLEAMGRVQGLSGRVTGVKDFVTAFEKSYPSQAAMGNLALANAQAEEFFVQLYFPSFPSKDFKGDVKVLRERILEYFRQNRDADRGNYITETFLISGGIAELAESAGKIDSQALAKAGLVDQNGLAFLDKRVKQVSEFVRFFNGGLGIPFEDAWDFLVERYLKERPYLQEGQTWALNQTEIPTNLKSYFVGQTSKFFTAVGPEIERVLTLMDKSASSSVAEIVAQGAVTRVTEKRGARLTDNQSILVEGFVAAFLERNPNINSVISYALTPEEYEEISTVVRDRQSVEVSKEEYDAAIRQFGEAFDPTTDMFPISKDLVLELALAKRWPASLFFKSSSAVTYVLTDKEQDRFVENQNALREDANGQFEEWQWETQQAGGQLTDRQQFQVPSLVTMTVVYYIVGSLASEFSQAKITLKPQVDYNKKVIRFQVKKTDYEITVPFLLKTRLIGDQEKLINRNLQFGLSVQGVADQKILTLIEAAIDDAIKSIAAPANSTDTREYNMNKQGSFRASSGILDSNRQERRAVTQRIVKSILMLPQFNNKTIADVENRFFDLSFMTIGQDDSIESLEQLGTAHEKVVAAESGLGPILQPYVNDILDRATDIQSAKAMLSYFYGSIHGALREMQSALVSSAVIEADADVIHSIIPSIKAIKAQQYTPYRDNKAAAAQLTEIINGLKGVKPEVVNIMLRELGITDTFLTTLVTTINRQPINGQYVRDLSVALALIPNVEAVRKKSPEDTEAIKREIAKAIDFMNPDWLQTIVSIQGQVSLLNSTPSYLAREMIKEEIAESLVKNTNDLDRFAVLLADNGRGNPATADIFETSLYLDGEADAAAVITDDVFQKGRTIEIIPGTASQKFTFARPIVLSRDTISGKYTLRQQPRQEEAISLDFNPGEEVIIGRGEWGQPAVGLRFSSAEQALNRAHVKIVALTTGQIVIEDLDTLNGTTLNLNSPALADVAILQMPQDPSVSRAEQVRGTVDRLIDEGVSLADFEGYFERLEKGQIMAPFSANDAIIASALGRLTQKKIRVTPKEIIDYAKDVMQELQKRVEVAASSVTSRTAQTADQTVGGINFDPALMNLQVKRDKNGVPLPLPQQDIFNINIEGLFPVIINIQPATMNNFPLLSSTAEEQKQLSKS